MKENLKEQKVTPFLWFNGTAQKAAKFYTSIFSQSKVISSDPMSATFTLDGVAFYAFNGGPYYKFSPAISLFVSCETQSEINYYWKKLSSGGKILRCGWLTDKYGVTWQIIPSILSDLLGDEDKAKSGRVMEAMLKMKKLDIAKLRKAHAGHA